MSNVNLFITNLGLNLFLTIQVFTKNFIFFIKLQFDIFKVGVLEAGGPLTIKKFSLQLVFL